MKAIGVGTPTFKLKDEHANTIKQGCHLVKIIDIRYGRSNSGEILHTRDGEVAFEAVLQNKAGETIQMMMWTTDAGIWVFKELCRAVGISYNADNKIQKDRLVGKFLWICVAGVYNTYRGEHTNQISKYLVLPDKMLPYFKGLKQNIPGDPLLGRNPHGTMFAIYNETMTAPKEKDLFDE